VISNGNGNGGLRRWLLGVAGTMAVALLLGSVTGLVTLYWQVQRLEASWEVPEGARGALALRERLTKLEGRVERLEDFRGEGRRFTRQDGDRIEQRIEALERRGRR
jgi:hypothetical protein